MWNIKRTSKDCNNKYAQLKLKVYILFFFLPSRTNTTYSHIGIWYIGTRPLELYNKPSKQCFEKKPRNNKYNNITCIVLVSRVSAFITKKQCLIKIYILGMASSHARCNQINEVDQILWYIHIMYYDILFESMRSS